MHDRIDSPEMQDELSGQGGQQRQMWVEETVDKSPEGVGRSAQDAVGWRKYFVYLLLGNMSLEWGADSGKGQCAQFMARDKMT